MNTKRSQELEALMVVAAGEHVTVTTPQEIEAVYKILQSLPKDFEARVLAARLETERTMAEATELLQTTTSLTRT